MTNRSGATVESKRKPKRGEGAALAAPAQPQTARAFGREVRSDHRGFMLRRLTVVADLLAMLVVGLVTLIVLDLLGRPLHTLDLELFVALIPLWLLIAISMRAYHPHSVGRGMKITIADEFGTVLRVATVWSWFFLLARTVTTSVQIQVLPSVLIWLMSVPVVLSFRSLLRRLVRSMGWYQQRVLVVGRAEDTDRVVTRIDRHPEWGLIVAEELDVAEGRSGNGARADVDSRLLTDLVEASEVSRVIFATPPEQLDTRTDLTRAFIESGMQVDLVPGEAEILRSGAEISDLEGLPLMSLPGARPARSWSVMKRVMDLAIGVPLLIAAVPLIAVSAIRIRLDSPGPIIYRQTRAGKDGRHFDFLKLRTMAVGAEDQLDAVADLSLHDGAVASGAFKAVDDPRITKVGRRLRCRSLDELPQLWNVVRGDMSLVGPRPLPVFEDERVAGHYELRRHVRPGMTGAWQVSGRSDIPFSEMLRLDYSYVLNWSLGGDLKLLVQTVDAVLRGRGAY
jgi:exopolysaccharide biosynthesis polyprenyl glycosylphosphotransferase